MIHTLLDLGTQPLFTIDCESTGVDTQKDRIVELAFEQWGPSGLVKEWCQRFNPGIPIPAAATKIHGITDEDVASKPRFKQLAANLAKGLSNCSFSGKNCRFDLRLISAEMLRAGVTWDYSKARIIDAERLEQLAVPRDLGSLHEKYTGRKHDGAHGALSDVRASTTVICKQLEAHASLPRDLDKLHELSWPGFIEPEGKFRFVDGVPCFGGWGKYANRPMRDADSGYWDFVLSKDFSAEIKALASKAKLGEYPS